MAATKTTTSKTITSAATKAPAKPATKVAAKVPAQPRAKPAVVTSQNAPTGITAPVALSAIPAPEPKVEQAAAQLKLKGLIDQVVKATGAKKKSVRDIVEATLASLGAALTKGEDLNLPPLGKAKVSRQRDLIDGEVIIVKLRRGGGARGGAGKDVKEDLAAVED
ncbi:MAG: HU family DNA-binding protein [Paracoccaceae bacterium]|nr:HU family DNA-binding protein [Paracoccaceae bacterium]